MFQFSNHKHLFLKTSRKISIDLRLILPLHTVDYDDHLNNSLSYTYSVHITSTIHNSSLDNSAHQHGIIAKQFLITIVYGLIEAVFDQTYVHLVLYFLFGCF